MAEVVGVAASVIGIAAFGQQIIQATLKIKQLYIHIKNAPTELQELLEEIEDLCRILDLLAADEVDDPGLVADVDSVKKSHALCRRAADRISGLATELQDRMRTRRYLGAVKMLVKKRDLEAMFLRLGRSKADLHLAHSIFVGVRQKRQYEELMGKVEELRVLQQGTVATVSSELALRERQTESKDVIPGSGRRIHFEFPRWFSQYACDISFQRASGCWTTTFRTYRVLPWQGEVWWMCFSGDIDGIRDLLVKGELHIHDVFRRYEPGFDDDITLWGVAIEWYQTHLAQFLLQQGVQAAWQPLLVWMEDFPRTFVSGLSFSRGVSVDEFLLASRKNAQFLLENDYECGNEEVVATIEAFAKVPSRLTRAEKLQIIRAAGWDEIWMIFDLWEILMEQTADSDSSFIDFIVTDPWFLHVVVENWAEEITSRSDPEQLDEWCDLIDSKHIEQIKRGGWSHLLTQAVKGGADLHLKKLGFTSLMKFWFRLCRLRPQAREKHVLQWLSTLAKAGVDLEKYVATERSLIIYECYESDLDPFQNWSAITGFENGPEPSDWRIWYRDTTDFYAGEFWDMIEHPERGVPGSWPEIWRSI